MHFKGAKHKKAEKAAGGAALAGIWKLPAPVVVPIPPPGISQVNVEDWIVFSSLKRLEILSKILVSSVLL
jgi:hypothetical protein